jgi:hypothetical protein
VLPCSPTGWGATAAASTSRATTDSWYLEFNRPPTPGPAAELLAEVRRWLAEERITQTIVWIGEQPFAVSG